MGIYSNLDIRIYTCTCQWLRTVSFQKPVYSQIHSAHTKILIIYNPNSLYILRWTMSQLKSFNLLIDTIGSSNGKEATIPSFGAILGPIVAILQRQSQKGLLTDGCLVQLCSFTRALVFYRKPCDNKPYFLYDNIKISLFYCLILWLIKYQTKTNICMFLIITVFLKFLEILRKLLSELISLKLYNKK